MRLDQYVALHFSFSRSQAARFVEEGRVRCNGHVVTKSSRKVSAGDTVTLEEARPRPSPSPHPSPSAHPLSILYEDDTCLVLNKPQDIAVAELLEELKAKQNVPSLFLVHRLDKGTTGCLLIAKSEKSCEALQKQFQNRSIHKQYLAAVAGVPKEREATIDAPVGRNLTDRKKMSLFHTSKSRSASTHYSVVSQSSEAALLQCIIHTGRTHQIRVHLRAIGHPILGDDTYGSEKSEALSRKYAIALPCLHAEMLSFQSPVTGKIVQSKAPLPHALKKAMEDLKLVYYSIK